MGAEKVGIHKRKKEITLNIVKDIIHENFVNRNTEFCKNCICFIKFSICDHIFYEKVQM